jgi:3-oxoacyl-[acyl-carrier-protein] synthase-3
MTSAGPPLGIAAIAVHQPGWELENSWFASTMPRKFAHHTGIEARGISVDDEVSMGLQAVRRLQRDTGCDLSGCRGMIFVSPSLIPPVIARRHLSTALAEEERPRRTARRLARDLGMSSCRTMGVNWFCCGYARALSLVVNRWAGRLELGPNDFLLVVVATRISRITDFGCSQTGGLFGDMASATLLAPVTSRRHPVHFEIVHARAERRPTDRPVFDFHLRGEVPIPAPDGGRIRAEQRLVYSLDGMAVAEIAPRAMSECVAASLRDTGMTGAAVDYVVPHQAGTGIVRFTGMKLEELGVGGELINGLTRRTGNVSACSIPHALERSWERIGGLVACPAAAVGSPGRAEVLQGCVLLRGTAHHQRRAVAAA